MQLNIHVFRIQDTNRIHLYTKVNEGAHIQPRKFFKCYLSPHFYLFFILFIDRQATNTWMFHMDKGLVRNSITLVDKVEGYPVFSQNNNHHKVVATQVICSSQSINGNSQTTLEYSKLKKQQCYMARRKPCASGHASFLFKESWYLAKISGGTRKSQ